MPNALLTRENLLASPIEEGDAGVILKPDGSFKVFSTGDIDGANLTPAQTAQGEKLIALSMALFNPEIMDILLNMSRDPAIVGRTVDTGRPN